MLFGKGGKLPQKPWVTKAMPCLSTTIRHPAQQPAESAGKVPPSPIFAPAPLPASRHHALLCHPGSPCSAIQSITADASLDEAGRLILSYRLSGNPQAILLPAPQPPGPVDDLWQHTCCEAFIALPGSPAYREFNFSPSGLWAAYQFADYRSRAPGFQPAGVPDIAFRRLPDGFQLDASLGRELLPAGDTLQLGLSVVVEAGDHAKSYWALAHAAARPDFHLRQSFTLTLNIKPI
jgi:hypothetical protein